MSLCLSVCLCRLQSVGCQLQSFSGCWLEVNVEHSGQLLNHYCYHASGKIWTPCYLSTDHSFLINLTCVCMFVLVCTYVAMCVCVCSLLAEGQECPSVCGCTWLQRVMDESGTLPSIFLFIYLFKLGVVSKWSIAHWQMPMYMNMCAW